LGSSSEPAACPCGRAPPSPCPTDHHPAARRLRSGGRGRTAERHPEGVGSCVQPGSAPKRRVSGLRIPARTIKPGPGTTRSADENLVKNPQHSTVLPVSRRRAPGGDPQVARRRPANRAEREAKNRSDPKVRRALRRLPTETERTCSLIPAHGSGAWKGRSELRPDPVPCRSRPRTRRPLAGKAGTWYRAVLAGGPKPICQPAGRNPLA
jgi:hypothetical protein